MDIRKLRCFLAVCKYGSILKASEKLFISQQALSKTITSLESEIGQPLFIRNSKGIVVTKLGNELRRLAIPVVDSMDNLERQISITVKDSKNEFRIGIASGMLQLFPSSVTDQLRKSFPDLEIAIEEYPYYSCEDMTAKGDLSVSLVNGPVSDPRLSAEEIAVVNRYVILQKDHPLAQKASVDIADLAPYSLALNINNRCFSFLHKLSDQEGIRLSVHRVSDTISMLNLCSTENYIGMYPNIIHLQGALTYSNLMTIPLKDGVFPYSLEIVSRKREREEKEIKNISEKLKGIILSLI